MNDSTPVAIQEVATITHLIHEFRSCRFGIIGEHWQDVAMDGGYLFRQKLTEGWQLISVVVYGEPPMLVREYWIARNKAASSG